MFTPFDSALNEAVNIKFSFHGVSEESTSIRALALNAEATLLLAREQRMANIIAAAAMCDRDGNPVFPHATRAPWLEAIEGELALEEK